jgi:hypothetical protein
MDNIFKNVVLFGAQEWCWYGYLWGEFDEFTTNKLFLVVKNIKRLVALKKKLANEGFNFLKLQKQFHYHHNRSME